MSRSAAKNGDMKKVSGELLALTYGSLVVQLLQDYENVDDVNRQLERLGHNMGVRLVEDFLARTSPPRCHDLRDTADRIQQAFRHYLGVGVTVGGWSQGGDEFSVTMETNPLSEFVEIPEHLTGLQYSNMLAGVIRGACEMVQIEVAVKVVADTLKGDPSTDLRVKFVKRMEDTLPAGED